MNLLFKTGLVFLFVCIIQGCGGAREENVSYTSISISNIKQQLDKIASEKVEGSSTYSYDVIITTDDDRQAWNMAHSDKLLAIENMRSFQHHFGGRNFPQELYVITADMISMEDGRDFTSKKVLKGLSYYIIIDVYCHSKSSNDDFKKKLSSIVDSTTLDYENKYIQRASLYQDNGVSIWNDLCYLGDLEYKIPADSTDTVVTPIVDLYGINEWSETGVETSPATVDMNVEINLDRLEKSKKEESKENQKSQEKLIDNLSGEESLDQEISETEQKEDSNEDR